MAGGAETSRIVAPPAIPWFRAGEAASRSEGIMPMPKVSNEDERPCRRGRAILAAFGDAVIP